MKIHSKHSDGHLRNTWKMNKKRTRKWEQEKINRK